MCPSVFGMSKLLWKDAHWLHELGRWINELNRFQLTWWYEENWNLTPLKKGKRHSYTYWNEKRLPLETFSKILSKQWSKLTVSKESKCLPKHKFMFLKAQSNSTCFLPSDKCQQQLIVIRSEELLEPTTAAPLLYRFSLLSKEGYHLKSHPAAKGNSAALQNRHSLRTPVLVTSRCCNCKCVSILPSEQEGLWSGRQCHNWCTLRIKAFGMNWAVIPSSEAVPWVTNCI